MVAAVERSGGSIRIGEFWNKMKRSETEQDGVSDHSA